MNTLSINQGYYFPLSFRLFGGALPIFSLVFLTQNNYILAALGVVMAFLLLTTKYQIILDFDQRNYFEHLWILGYKRGDAISFNNVEKLIVSSRNISKTYNSRGSTNTVRSIVYFLCVIIDGERVELLETEKESRIDELQGQLVSIHKELSIEDHRD